MPAAAYIHAAGGLGLDANVVLDWAAAKSVVDAQPVDLRPLGKSLGIAMPRLSSRFAELAVIGARLCANSLDLPLANRCPVYLASGLGDVARSDALYYQVMPPSSEMASPAQFATSGNNMGAFFVAQHLGLASRNFTISQTDLSLEHALILALDDLRDGIVAQVLLGGVDETTLPREFYVRRYPLSENKCIGEGSGWLVLGKEAVGAIGEVLESKVIFATADNDGEKWADHIASTTRLLMNSHGAAMILPGVRMSDVEIAALRTRLPSFAISDHRDVTGCFPTAVALTMVGTFAQKPSSDTTYLHVNRDARGRTGIVRWRVYGTTTARVV